MSGQKRVLFIFDRVTHYHKDLFVALHNELPKYGVQLDLLSGETVRDGKGRTGLSQRVLEQEVKYRFFEYPVGSFVFRRHAGVAQVVRRMKPDAIVIQSHVGNVSYWHLMRMKKRLGFKLVAWQCGYEYNPSRLKNAVLGRFLNGFDLHLAYHSNAGLYATQHGVPDERVCVTHNTIDERRMPLLPRSQARELVSKVHPEIADRRIVLFVGAVLAEKRVELILDALELLGRKDVVLVVVGDGDQLAPLRAKCQGRSDVVFTGAVIAEVGPYFDAADVYVLPGTGGLGINEAMAHSLPVISGFADGSADDLVVDGRNGYRLCDGTAEELAAKLTLVLDNPQEARRMGEQSRLLITGPYSFDHFVDRIVSSLASLLAEE